MPLCSGDVLGRYVIDRAIGHGGMGNVYRAFDTRLGRPVALKVLDAEKVGAGGQSTGGSARILREARIAAKLEHPNVVAIYDVDEVLEGEHACVAYLAMELVEGRSLRACVGDASVPQETRLRWMTEIARGLAAAHDRGLVHRDVKPENVAIRTDGVAKVLDFGIAKQLAAPAPPSSSASPMAESVAAHSGSTTGEGVVIGTPYYMSPEQMKGLRVDARSDQFSWGVVAYELVCGVPPWGTQLPALQIVAAILGTEPTAPHIVNPDAPAWLGPILQRAMAKSADARFASMHEVIASLEAGASGRTTTANAEATTARQDRRAGWNRGSWLGTGLIVVGALAVGAAVTRFASRTSVSARTPSVAATDASGCTNVACTKSLAAAAICANASCVPLDSPDCHVKADATALSSEKTLWIGSLYPLTGPDAEMGRINERATDLARQDFADATPQLAAGGAPVRPIGLVSCDESADATRATRHLVEELHVPAIVGFARGKDLISLMSSLLGPHETLAVDALTTSPLVTEIAYAAGQAPLVWRTTYGGSAAARALSALVEGVLEPELRAEGVRRTRVAVVRQPSALNLSERLFDALRFNGRTALDNESDYQEVIIDTDDPNASARALARMREFAPSVIVYTSPEVMTPILTALEMGWPVSAGPRPRYVTNLELDDDTLAVMDTNADLRHRMFGLTLPSTTPPNGRFTLHYNGVYGTSVSRADAPSSAYDAFYLVAYASLALRAPPATGRDLAAGIRKLVGPGVSAEVGPGGIFEAFAHLRAGESIDLVGAGSPLDLDLATGENAVNLSILCPEIDKHGKAIGSLESGLVYSDKTRSLVGKMSCP